MVPPNLSEISFALGSSILCIWLNCGTDSIVVTRSLSCSHLRFGWHGAKEKLSQVSRLLALSTYYFDRHYACFEARARLRPNTQYRPREFYFQNYCKKGANTRGELKHSSGPKCSPKSIMLTSEQMPSLAMSAH